MRFGEQKNTSDSSRRRELVPTAFADDMQIEVSDDAVTNLLQRG
jgi:hypothetical protein